jgi:MoxR-like ATPase
VDYPDAAAERAMLLATTGADEARPEPAMTARDLWPAQALIRRIPVGEQVVDAILRLVRGARPANPGCARCARTWPGARARAPPRR